jgi:MFS family permease
MPDVSGPGGGPHPHLPPTAGLGRTAAEAALEPGSPATHRVGWGFISLYSLAYISTSLMFIAPLLVTLALKVNSLVGIERAPDSLALVAGIAAALAVFGNPFFGMMSDRTSSRLGMRRPWMVIGLAGGSLGILVVALAPSIAVALVGWCLAQLFFNALLAAMVAVLPDQMCRSRYSWVPSPSQLSLSPLPSLAASSLTGRAGGKSSCSLRRLCTAWRCS